MARGRPKTFDRAHVIDVATENYARDDLHTLSLNEICRRAGVSKPGVYREFGGEDGLMDAVLQRYSETVLTPVTALIAQDRPFIEGLAALVAFMTDTEGAEPRGCLLAKMRESPSRLGPDTRATVAALRAGGLASYANWVERAKGRGEISDAVPTAVAAAFLDTQFTILLLKMAQGEDPKLLRAQARLAFAGLTGARYQ
jgi:AcrR family transcriptional regulator